jgi:hypothetical protein
MASSSSKTPGVPPKIPKRRSSKRTRKQLETDYTFLRWQDLEARKKIKPSHSFDANYWLSAAAASDVSAKIHDVETKLAIQEWKEEDGGGNGDTMGCVRYFKALARCRVTLVVELLLLSSSSRCRVTASAIVLFGGLLVRVG